MKFILSVKNPKNAPLTMANTQVSEIRFTLDTDEKGAADIVNKTVWALNSSDPEIKEWLQHVYEGQSTFDYEDDTQTHTHRSDIMIAWWFE